MNRIILILIFAACSSACAGFNRPTVDSTEIVERSSVPAEKAAVDDIEYLNLCVHKDCDATRLSYTQAFRDAAVMARAIRELDRFTLDAIASGETRGLSDSSAHMPSLTLELERIRARLEALNPGSDFESVSLQILTRKALIAARQDIDEARNALRRAHQNMEEVLGEDPLMLVDWKTKQSRPEPAVAARYGGAQFKPLDACVVANNRMQILVLD